MSKANIFYAHSGGVTSILNLIAATLIQASRNYDIFDKVLVGKNGILGAINDQLYDTSYLSENDLSKIAQTPASIFGSCRYKLAQGSPDFAKIFEVFAKHNIKYVIYNGGNDSQDTTNKLWQASQELGYELQCIGLPKTIDNDLMGMDCCPGFGSAAKYIATSTKEAALDVKSMAETSTKVFILEVMGRHAGWLAASAALAQNNSEDAPHIILMPEVAFDANKFLAKVKATVANKGYCVVVASEGIKTAQQEFVAASNSVDAFGHQQLGGVAVNLAAMVKAELGYKLHWAVADYLQRSAGHLRSAVDVAQAKALAEHALAELANGANGKVFAVERLQQANYAWQIIANDIEIIANQERSVPKNWITADGMHVTQACKDFMQPWIEGESQPSYKRGVPDYFTDELPLV